MNADGQVILVLKLLLNIAPPALYFVILGLVNSHSKPNLISSRNDWLALMIVFCPILLFPVLWLASGGFYLTALIALALAVVIVIISVPRHESGWVIYNCSRHELRKALLGALEDAGIDYELVSAQIIRLTRLGLELRLSGLPLLKNTTISFGEGKPRPEFLRDLERTLHDRIDRIDSAVNPSGPALLLAGTSMLILPLLMMVRHMDAFVRVVCDLLPV